MLPSEGDHHSDVNRALGYARAWPADPAGADVHLVAIPLPLVAARQVLAAKFQRIHPRLIRQLIHHRFRDERALRMATPHDAVDAAREVVDVHLALSVRPTSLRPGREAAPDVRLAPAARPEVPVRIEFPRTDLRHPAAARVPGKRREVREVVGERVVLVPDQPAAVEAPVALVVAGARETTDARDAARARIDPHNTREPGRVELCKEAPAVAGAHDREDGGVARQRDHRAQDDALPRRRLRRAAPARRRDGRARAGAQSEHRDDRSEAKHAPDITPPHRPVPCFAWPSSRRRSST